MKLSMTCKEAPKHKYNHQRDNKKRQEWPNQHFYTLKKKKSTGNLVRERILLLNELINLNNDQHECHLDPVMPAMGTGDGTAGPTFTSFRRAKQCTLLPVLSFFTTSTTARNATIANTQTVSAGQWKRIFMNSLPPLDRKSRMDVENTVARLLCVQGLLAQPKLPTATHWLHCNILHVCGRDSNDNVWWWHHKF